MNEKDGKALCAGFSTMRDLEAQLDAIDFENDPSASDKYDEIVDLLMALSMGMGRYARPWQLAQQPSLLVVGPTLKNRRRVIPTTPRFRS